MRTNRLLLLFAPALLTVTAFAQAPQGFSYQAVARDAFGTAVAVQPVGVQFVLHQGNALGAVVYAETHSTSTNTNGLFALTVGAGSSSVGSFNGIDWSTGPYFLEVAMDVSSSGGYTPIGTQQLMSVPYALYAGKSNVPDGTEVGQILHWDGGAWVADSGLYVAVKRFGIGDSAPECPLGIKGEAGQDDRMISFASNDAVQKWNINLNPSANDVPGFSIDDATTGLGTSRLFISGTTGNVGIGNTTPEAPLSIESRDHLYAAFQNGDIPEGEDFRIGTGGNTGLNIEQDTIGGFASRFFIESATGHIGIGTNEPEAPLAIESRDILKTYFQTGEIPTQNDFGFTSSETTGFGIEQGTPSSLTNRFFIQGTTGFVGIGTVTPEQKMHIESSTPSGITGIKILNTASTSNQGWSFGHLQDPVTERDGAFSLIENTGSELMERITVLASGNVGINEPVPSTVLHVRRPAGDPATGTPLDTDGGIATFGDLIDSSLNFEEDGLQARQPAPPGSPHPFEASSLNLQRMGGEILIHGDAAVAALNKAIITDDARLGLGTITPVERIDIDGAIRIGTSLSDNDGTIRFTGTDFEGRKGGAWASLTGENGAWSASAPNAIHYSPPGIGNVGINEVLPYATLHVSRPPSDPLSSISLNENTGIVVIGPVLGQNLGMDSHQIQARTGSFLPGTTTLSLSTTPLNIQPLGGDVVFHSDATIPDDRKVVISDAGLVGLGKYPIERLDVNGAITIGNTQSSAPVNGTIRYNGTDFQGRASDGWVDLSSPWRRQEDPDGKSIWWREGPRPRVGIGTETPSATLHVRQQDPPPGPGPSTGLFVDLIDSQVNIVEDRYLIGLRVYNHSVSPGTENSRNIGLYVSEVSGQSSSERNLAAVLNGNVVVGDITGQSVGTGGTNVLAIQNGDTPTTAVGATNNGGIQIYSDDLSGVSTFHIMRGNGDVIKLYRQAALTPADASTVGPVYDPTTAALIENMRTRINDLEARLSALGLLTP